MGGGPPKTSYFDCLGATDQHVMGCLQKFQAFSPDLRFKIPVVHWNAVQGRACGDVST